MQYRTTIGLEIHIQLKTKSKMFCRCSNDGEQEPPNTTVCPICLGHPGVLPVLNKQAVEYGVLMGLALNGTIPEYSKFDRKNYFYPDLPKGYQISQYDQPLVKNGYVDLVFPQGISDRKTARIRINRLHLEEDAAKLIHSNEFNASLVDFNRSSTPLAEIVTEPDFKNPAEAKYFLQELRLLARYMNISTADMEKGHLRCDANISVQTDENGIEITTPISEIKNLNSFRSVERALEYEGKRLYEEWVAGGDIRKRNYKITVGWDEQTGKTVLQRWKENAHDYRYFPEPDLPPLHFTDKMIEEYRLKIPELPVQKRIRFEQEYSLSPADSNLLVESQKLGNFFEMASSELDGWLSSVDSDLPDTKSKALKLLANWLINKFPPLLTEKGSSLETTCVTPENFAELICCLITQEVNSTVGQQLLAEMITSNQSPKQLIKEKNLGQVSNMEELNSLCDLIITQNTDAVQNYKNGKIASLMFLVGQVMKELKGRGNPEKLKSLLVDKLK